MLAVLPLTGVRIVCITDTSATDAAGQPDDALACQTMCSRHPSPHYRSRCALVEDPACAFALGSPTAVLTDAPALRVTRTSVPFDVYERAAYVRPTLDRASPPPKI